MPIDKEDILKIFLASILTIILMLFHVYTFDEIWPILKESYYSESDPFFESDRQRLSEKDFLSSIIIFFWFFSGPLYFFVIYSTIIILWE